MSVRHLRGSPKTPVFEALRGSPPLLDCCSCFFTVSCRHLRLRLGLYHVSIHIPCRSPVLGSRRFRPPLLEPKAMRRATVRSSVIASVGYSPEERILEIEFHSGRLYQYFGVPPVQHAQLMAAESIGRYFNTSIRDKYEEREVPR